MHPVFIIILNYKKWQDTMECLESVFQSSYKNFSVIVIDNDSQNNSLEHLMQWADTNTGHNGSSFTYNFLKRDDIAELTSPASFSRLTFIQNSINAGFAGGINVVLRVLQEQDAYVWLLNPDMVVTKNAITELASFANQQPLTSVTGALIKSFSGNQSLLFFGGFKVNFLAATVNVIKKPGNFHQLDYISGGCLFTHASNWKRLGLLPEAYFLYWEETDWCYRAKLSGYSLHVCTTAICYDKGSTVIGKNFLADYYYIRNGLLFISKFRKKNIPFVLFFVGIRFFLRIVTGRWDRARGVFKGTIDFFKMNAYAGK